MGLFNQSQGGFPSVVLAEAKTEEWAGWSEFHKNKGGMLESNGVTTVWDAKH